MYCILRVDAGLDDERTVSTECTLAGHNGCYFCLREVQKCKPECPLCRQAFPADYPLHPNPVLKQLVTTAQFQSGGVDEDGWESVPTRAHAVMMHAQDLEALQTSVPSQSRSVPTLQQPRPTHEVVRDAAAQHMSPAQHPLAILAGSYRNSAEPRHSYESILSWVPPQWMPDSCARECKACCLPFKPVVRLRHHCRLCGLIFCHTCSSKRVLLPPKCDLSIDSSINDEPSYFYPSSLTKLLLYTLGHPQLQVEENIYSSTISHVRMISILALFI